MKEKIYDWWTRNIDSDWFIALLLTCIFTIAFLIVSGIIALIKILCEINIVLLAVAIFVLIFLAFLFLLKVG